jgi:DNA-binding NarL/FixJ family response regulator
VSAEEATGRQCWEVLCGVDERGGLVCHRGCSSARLMRQGWPVAAQELFVKTAGGRKEVMVSTIAINANGSDPLYIHMLRNSLEPVAVEEKADQEAPELTRRQLEVLSALAAGQPAKLIASELGIAETTVRNHIRMILIGLGCHSQLEAVAEARRRGLVS